MRRRTRSRWARSTKAEAVGKKITYVCDHCGAEFDPDGPLAKIWILGVDFPGSGDFRGGDIEFARGYTDTARELWKDVEAGELSAKVDILCGADCATAVFDRWIEESGPKDES